MNPTNSKNLHQNNIVVQVIQIMMERQNVNTIIKINNTRVVPPVEQHRMQLNTNLEIQPNRY